MARFPVRAPSWLLALLILGCGDGARMIDPPAPGPAVTIALSPSSHDLVFLDETVQLTALARDAAGAVVSGVSFSWASSDPSVVDVDQNGLATAVGGGQAEITVEAEGLSASATLHVTGPSDLTFLHAKWGGDAVAYTDAGTRSMGVAGIGESVVGGFGTRLDLVVGSGADARELVALGRASGIAIRLGLADGYRGTFVVSDGFFDGRGGVSLESGSRLGGGQVERIRMGGFREASFDLFVDASTDEGATWEPVWAFHLDEAGGGPEVPVDRSPACTGERYADFDFWTGDWDVTSGGSPSGTNRIEATAAMCGIQENWTSTGGGTGISLSMFDSRSGDWTQLWVDSGGLVLELSGGLSGGSMVLEGPRNAAGTIVDRTTWTPYADGTVRQLWETNTGGTGWVTSFDGLYRPSG